jgi:hypothetical protein
LCKPTKHTILRSQSVISIYRIDQTTLRCSIGFALHLQPKYHRPLKKTCIAMYGPKIYIALKARERQALTAQIRKGRKATSVRHQRKQAEKNGTSPLSPEFVEVPQHEGAQQLSRSPKTTSRTPRTNTTPGRSCQIESKRANETRREQQDPPVQQSGTGRSPPPFIVAATIGKGRNLVVGLGRGRTGD